MINLDSEAEGIFTAGCAGGNLTECIIPVSREKHDGVSLKITVKGLKGGHSGEMIHCGRANSSILLGRILDLLGSDIEMRIVCVDGGMKDNAIPVESTAVIVVSDADKEKAVLKIKEIEYDFKNEYKTSDSSVCVTAENVDNNILPMTEADGEKIVDFLTCAPNGLIEMSMDIKDLPQTSLNLGILKTAENYVSASYCVRSSVSSQKEMLKNRLKRITKRLGGTIEFSGDYPAWEFKPDSSLLELCSSVYARMYGVKPVVTAMHGGLECGLFSEKIRGLDCVSFGPNILDIHTPREKLSLSSLKRSWEFVLEVLKEMR